MKNKKTALFIMLILILVQGGVFAQSNTSGSIYGSVVNPAKEPLNNVKVTVSNKETGFSRTVNTNADGAFRFSALAVGTYDIQFEAAGYIEKKFEGVRVNVGVGSNISEVMAPDDGTEVLDKVSVVGGKVSVVDIESVESTTIFTEEEYDRLPVSRDLTSIALLAPGTTVGDGAFGDLASFGGSSVAENAYFVNGMDVTDFRNGLGGSTVPFEFYQEFQVKTGGYGVEFGRSTGGVVNAITKRGSNEWHFGAGVHYSPDELTKNDPDVFKTNGDIYTLNNQDEDSNANYYFEASGPIVKDHLFFYLLYNPRDIERTYVTGSGTQGSVQKRDDAFWGAKIDWQITDKHKVELTGFSDKQDYSTSSYDYDLHSRSFGDLKGTTTSERGGDNFVAKYTGYITPSLTISAMYGENEARSSNISPLDDNPAIYDSRGGSTTRLGNWVNFQPSRSSDSREQMRFDVEWALGMSHVLKAGIDQQTNTSDELSFYSGHVYYRYYDDSRSSTGQSVRVRIYENGGSFEVESGALYLEDTWTVTDNLVLSLGLRNESFDNKNANGESFIKIDDQLAPRLGVSWDVFGNGDSKVFATLGRYHLPIASNTNVRLAGSELYTQQYYELQGLNADDTPIIGPAIGSQSVFGDGTVPSPDSILDSSIEPMYQDELIIGFEKEWFDGFRGGARFIYRDLKSTIEDVAIDAALNTYAAANGYNNFNAGGFDYYVLTNPGTDMNIRVDLDGDGTLEDVFLPASMLGYPESQRTYRAFEIFFKKVWNGTWSLDGSYTFARSRGNNEGYVRSDNGQDDAGLTTLFDQPGLLDGAYGPLPNEREHTIKLYGTWEFVENWQLGLNFLASSGRPINAFGRHPTDAFAAQYGAESFYQQGTLVPRGSKGRTPFVTNFDLSLQYTMDLGWRNSQARFRMDVFNLFNSHTVTEVIETADQDNGEVNPNYLLPTNFQSPQYVRFSTSIEF